MPIQPSDSNEVDIEFHGVTKRFDDVIAVDNVSLTVERGAWPSRISHPEHSDNTIRDNQSGEGSEESSTFGFFRD